ncbi:glycosyltransferase [Maribacter litopenaei]|uniref:Glycosyltransferase n=1 Tax=Maribacter litopenaei TaxID=2976127 RepID=A0ABY5Y977_9FLAO|nr:glycosyltransferase [Maribacter litopenaei]UWX55005.1 glycosyltransferase [Maribacter litopenaei]
MRKLKICMFVPFYPIVKGGAEYQSKLIAVKLKEIGHEIIFVSDGLQGGKVEMIQGFKVFGTYPPSSPIDKLTLYKFYLDFFKKVLTQEKPDIVYQRILNTYTLRASKISNSLNIPFVLHIADNYSVEFNGWKGFFKRLMFQQILKAKIDVICQTEYQYTRIKGLGEINRNIISNMHPRSMTTIQRKDENLILWIGNVRPVKQLEVYIWMAKRLIHTQYKFMIIGDIPKNEYGIQLIAEIEKSCNITYVGQRDNKYINEELAGASLLVNTSISEGFSNTFIQAWMCGTPVLSLNSDPDGVMKRYGLGISCSGSKERMLDEIGTILKVSSYEERSNRIKAIAENQFSIDRNICKIEKIFEEAYNK